MDLSLVVILEKDSNGDVLAAWSYPLLEPSLEKVLIAKSQLQEDHPPSGPFYSKFRESWIYGHTLIESPTPLPPRVVGISLVVLSKTFNPERFCRLTELLAKRHATSGQPPSVLQAYLGAYAREEFDFGADGKFSSADFDDRKALVKGSLKNLFSTFGVESAIIYLGMILKKRIVVFCSQLPLLLDSVRSLPLLVWHRKNWAILRPFVTPSQNEIDELDAAGVYVAGFTDRLVEAREELYDLFVDIDNRSVSVASHAKNDFMLGKSLKELGVIMSKLVEDPASTEQQIIKEVAIKTKEFLDNLESSVPEGGTITVEGIQELGLQPAAARFLWNLAMAEGRAQM